MKGGPGFPGGLQASFTAGVPEASSAGRMVKMNGGPGRLSREVRLRIKDVPVAGGYAILWWLVPGPGGAAGPGRSVGLGCAVRPVLVVDDRSEEHTSERQSLRHLVCRLLLEKKKDLYAQLANVRTSTAFSYDRLCPPAR